MVLHGRILGDDMWRLLLLLLLCRVQDAMRTWVLESNSQAAVGAGCCICWALTLGSSIMGIAVW